ncbi:MAG: HepT-like ribonuclease domain-containing protein [Euzebya sp.]
MDEGLSTHSQPWSELVGFRNRLAHILPDDLDHDRVYEETTADLYRLRLDIAKQDVSEEG